MCDTAIEVSDVTKVYRLYERQRDRLWETLGLDRKKTYKEKYALNHVSFRVKRGETVGIIGTNGSGKSTMLKLITGVLTPTAGSIRVDGRISALLELGAGFNMEYTGIENVYLNGAMIGFTKEEIDARLDDIISFADIGDYINQPVKSYSSGMFVRLAFAVAINIDPEILIVDEALSVGDVFFQSKCYRKFEEFRRAGKTILFVSHDLSAISRYCDRAILLNQGDLIYDGTPKEAIDLYKKVLVGQYEEKPAEQPEAADGEKREIQGIGSDSGLWKSRYPVNPSLIEYGEKNGEIVDYALLDENGLMTSNFLKGTVFTVRMKIRAHADILEPIFAFTIKNMKGIEICGTNTTMEHVPVPTMHDGDEHYQDGMFRVFHRLYDVISLTVVSNRDTVGFYDMNSTCVLDPEI